MVCVRSLKISQPQVFPDLTGMAASAREALRGLGYMEVMTLPLVCEESAYDALRLPRDAGRVVIDNPISSEQTMVRTDLAPGLLATFAVNASHELPQRVFEVGRVSRCEEEYETGAAERHHAAAGLIGPQAGFTDARALAEALLAELGWSIQVRPDERGLYLPGRGAAILAREAVRPIPLARQHFELHGIVWRGHYVFPDE